MKPSAVHARDLPRGAWGVASGQAAAQLKLTIERDPTPHIVRRRLPYDLLPSTPFPLKLVSSTWGLLPVLVSVPPAFAFLLSPSALPFPSVSRLQSPLQQPERTRRMATKAAFKRVR